MTNRISRKALDKKIKFFLKYKIPFRLEYTNERMIVHAQGRWGSWMNKESSFKASELSFIKGVKDHIIKNETFKKVRNNFKAEGSTKKIKYFYYNKSLKSGDHIDNIIEIDIKGAYWYQAYALGLFDKRIYEKGLTVSKKSRLAAIGSLAKVKNILEFDGKEEKDLPPVRSEQTEFLWNVISYRIGKLMAKAQKIAKSDFLFFWVDAIFVRGESAKAIEKLFKDAGFECSSAKCEWIKIDDKKITVKSTEKGKWITKKEEKIVTRDGKRFRVTEKTKEFRDERPFPYAQAQALSEKDIITLNNG